MALGRMPSRFSLFFAHDLSGKPLHTFPDHALARTRMKSPGSDRRGAGAFSFDYAVGLGLSSSPS
jgi:hypothetical protein